MGDSVRQFSELLAGRPLDPTEPGGSLVVIDIYPIEE